MERARAAALSCASSLLSEIDFPQDEHPPVRRLAVCDFSDSETGTTSCNFVAETFFCNLDLGITKPRCLVCKLISRRTYEIVTQKMRCQINETGNDGADMRRL